MAARYAEPARAKHISEGFSVVEAFRLGVGAVLVL